MITMLVKSKSAKVHDDEGVIIGKDSGAATAKNFNNSLMYQFVIFVDHSGMTA